MWVKIEDQFPDHPKIRSLGAIGLALQMAAICYCARYLTDGFLSYSAADALVRSVLAPFTLEDGSIQTVAISCGMSGEDANQRDWKPLMVKAGLWESREGGYLVHDYLDYNPSRREVMHLRKIRSESGQAGGLAKAKHTASKSHSKNVAKVYPVPVPVPESVPKEKDTSNLLASHAADSPTVSSPLAELSNNGHPGFVEFWASYPNRVGKAKALGEWRKQRLEAKVEEVLSGLGRTWDYLTREGGKFVPNPATWLHQGRWQDEPRAPSLLTPKTQANVEALSRFVERHQERPVP